MYHDNKSTIMYLYRFSCNGTNFDLANGVIMPCTKLMQIR